MPAKDAKPDPELLQVRLTRTEREQLEAASPNGKAATEIMRIVREHQAGAAGTAERAIGDLAALVAGRAIATMQMLSPEDLGWDADKTPPPDHEAARDANRYNLLALVREALAKALNEIGAQYGDLPDPDVITAVTFDLAKRLHTQTTRDPESRTLTRIGKALGLEMGMSAENLDRQRVGAPTFKTDAREKDQSAVSQRRKDRGQDK